MCHCVPCVCQDVSSFGNRCIIFRQVASSLVASLCVCVPLGPCVCQDVSSFGNSLYPVNIDVAPLAVKMQVSGVRWSVRMFHRLCHSSKVVVRFSY